MRRSLLCLLLVATLLPAAGSQAAPRGPYRAQPLYENDLPDDGPYGGGFIEMLLTGREPSPHIRRARPVPVDPYTGWPAEPYAGGRPAPRGAVTLLPPSYSFEPEEEGIGMAIDPAYERQVVAYNGREPAGTIIIDTPSRFLYLVEPGRRAIRYGIGVGRPGFSWAGLKSVSMKREWPDWRPPAEMLKRRPDLPRHMPGGIDNPLGARALYLGSSLYRIHGTNEPHTIGRAVSSGCIRMLNEDVIDLFDRVRVGTRVVVI